MSCHLTFIMQCIIFYYYIIYSISFFFADYWRKFLMVIANDYSFLFILGVLMALISFMLDFFIEKCQMGECVLSFSVSNLHCYWTLAGIIKY